MCWGLRSPKSCFRWMCLGACLYAFVAPRPAAAQSPAPLPSNSAQTATALEPRAGVVAAITGGPDAVWYTIVGDAPSWQKFFSSGRQSVVLFAQRLGDGCAAQALRVTAYTGTGVLLTSAPVYRGAAASVLMLPASPGTRYDLRVDTALDPGCAGPVRYAIRAEPYTPVITGSSPPIYNKNATKCEVYRGQVTQLRNRFHHTRKGNLRKKLNKDLRNARAIVASVC
jgi:hypothetical protein